MVVIRNLIVPAITIRGNLFWYAYNNISYRFPALQTSRETWLSNCRFYYMEALMKQSGVKDCLSVGMRLPNGTYERPITGQHLYWIRPGGIHSSRRKRALCVD